MADNPPIPVDASQDARTLGWLMEAMQESEGFLKAQDGYEQIQPSIDAIKGWGASATNPLSKLSQVKSNRIGKLASDYSALLTNIKPFWEYKTDNERLQKQAMINGKLSTEWYYNRQIDLRFGDMTRYSSVAGCSYANLTWDTNVQDVACSGEDPRDVLPIRPSGGYESIQNAMGVIIRRERSVNYVKELYPSKAALIVADRDGSVGAGGGGSTAQLYRNLGIESTPFQQALWGEAPKRNMPRLPVVDLYTAYIRDDRRNESSNVVMIGQFDSDGRPLNNWSYKVQPGDLLYPNKRMIQFTKTVVLYDSTSIYWHGMFPLCKFSLDPWPWSWFGKAPLWDLLPLQGMYDTTLRAISDLMAKMVQPDIIADKQSISRAALNTLNTRAAGQKFLSNMMGKGLQLQYPNVAGFEMGFKILEILRDEMDYNSGIRDMSQMMRLNQMPSADTIDKAMQSMTQTAQARSRIFEAFTREFAKMLAFNFSQFYTIGDRIARMGTKGITTNDLESFDPGSFIPDFIAPEDFNDRGQPTAEALARGPLPRMDRAKLMMEHIDYYVTPGSQLSSSEIESKLLYLQLYRSVPPLIDQWTLLEKLGIPNVGDPPAGPNGEVPETITDRLVAQQMMQLGLSAGVMQNGNEGRRPTGQAMPKLVQKDGGTRTTMSESK